MSLLKLAFNVVVYCAFILTGACAVLGRDYGWIFLLIGHVAFCARIILEKEAA